MPKRSWFVNDIEDAFVSVEVFDDVEDEEVVDSVDIDAEDGNFSVGESSISGSISVGVFLDLMPIRSLKREPLEPFDALELERLVLNFSVRRG